MADKGNLYLKNSAVIGLYDSTKAYETTVQETLYSQYKTAFKISKSNHFRGDAADSFKNYITNGTINIISGMMDISSDNHWFSIPPCFFVPYSASSAQSRCWWNGKRAFSA